MKFYKASKKISGTKKKKTFPKLSNATIQDPELIKMFEDREISYYNIMSDSVNVVDYFSCYIPSTRIKKEDWIKLDIFSAIGTHFPLIFSGFVVSPEVKNVFQQFILGEKHVFVPAKIAFQGAFLEYYYFQYIYTSEDYDWKSRVKIFYADNPEVLYHRQICEKRELFSYKYKYDRNNIWPDSIMQYEFDHYSDFIFIHGADDKAVSERVKDAIEKDGFIGVEFTEIPHYRFKFKDGLPK